MSRSIAFPLLLCVISLVHSFIPVTNNVKQFSADKLRPLRYPTELLAKKKGGSKLISDDFLSSLDQFDETPAVAKVVPPPVLKEVVVEKEKVLIVEPEASAEKVEGEGGDEVGEKKKKKKRDKSKKDYFSNVDLGDSKEEEVGTILLVFLRHLVFF